MEGMTPFTQHASKHHQERVSQLIGMVTDEIKRRKRFEEVELPEFEGIETKLPNRSTKKSAGYDFYLKQNLILKPGKTTVTFTDVKCCLEDDEVLYLHVRSSVGIKKHICLANGTGVIDADYYENEDNDGNIGIALYNYGDKEVCFRQGDRIAQGVIHRCIVDEDEEIYETRKGGIGHTGE